MSGNIYDGNFDRFQCKRKVVANKIFKHAKPQLLDQKPIMSPLFTEKTWNIEFSRYCQQIILQQKSSQKNTYSIGQFSTELVLKSFTYGNC